jgi:hypothetical protein
MINASEISQRLPGFVVMGNSIFSAGVRIISFRLPDFHTVIKFFGLKRGDPVPDEHQLGGAVVGWTPPGRM